MNIFANYLDDFEPYEQNMNIKLSVFDQVTLQLALEKFPDNFEDFKELTEDKGDDIKEFLETDEEVARAIFQSFLFNKNILSMRLAAADFESKKPKGLSIDELMSVLGSFIDEEDLEEV